MNLFHNKQLMPNVNHKENKLSVTTNAVFDIKLREAPYSSVLKSKDYNAFLYEVFMNYNAVSEKMLMKFPGKTKT